MLFLNKKLKNLLNTILLFFLSSSFIGQIPSYYHSINLNLTGDQLKNELSNLIIQNTNNDSLTSNGRILAEKGMWSNGDIELNNHSNLIIRNNVNDSLTAKGRILAEKGIRSYSDIHLVDVDLNKTRYDNTTQKKIVFSRLHNDGELVKAYIQFGNGSQAVFEFVCKHPDGFLFKDSGKKTFTFNNGKLSINNGDLKADRIEIFQRGPQNFSDPSSNGSSFDTDY